MGRSQTIGPKRRKKILELAKLGLTDSEISRALHFSKAEVRKIRDSSPNGGGKIDQSINKEPGKKHENRENDNPGGDHSNEGGEPGADNDQPGPGPNENGTSLNFVGGKKGMSKNNDDEEDLNECGACGHKFKGTPMFCPNCGVEFAEE